MNSVRVESRTSGIPARSTFRTIPDTPTAERISPTAKAVIPRIIGSPAFDRPMLDPKIEKKTIVRIGGNADAKSFLQEFMDEIEPIERNRRGIEKTNTVK